MNTEIDDNVRAEIIALRDDAISGFTRHREDFLGLERGYMNILSERQRLSLSRRSKSALTPNLILPKVHMVVRDVMKAFFSNDELADLSVENGADKEDERVNEILIEELKDYSREQNLYIKTKPIVRNMLVYGTGISKVYWNSSENTVKIEECRLDTVFVDPYAPNGNDIRFLVHRVGSMTIADMKRQYKKFAIDWAAYVDDSLVGDNRLTTDTEIGDYQRIEFFEVYRKKAGKWYVTTILNDDTILRLDVPLKDGLPFIVGTVEPQFVMLSEPVTPVRAYGASFIAPLLPIQIENTIKRNQQIDATDVQLNQRFIVTKTSGLREDDLLSNRKKITVDDINGIRELPIPRLNDSIFDTQQLAHEAEEISGVTKFTQGLDSGGKEKTAREVMALQSQGSSVTDDINRAFNEAFYRPLVRRIVTLIYKYKTSPRFIGIDRSRPLKQKVTINVGVGSTNKIIALENNDNAIATANTAIQTFMGLQDMERAQRYAIMLDALIEEKLKLLGQNSILDRVEVEMEKAAKEQAAQQQAQIQGGIA
ncbi:MAG: hypothetical protein AB7D43_03125 [Sulfurimonadaceae bacterium]